MAGVQEEAAGGEEDKGVGEAEPVGSWHCGGLGE